MKNLVTTIALVLAVCFGVAFDATAAVTVPVAGVVRASASGDTITTQLPYGATIVGVKVNPATASKYYRIRKGSASGAIIYETNSAATTATMSVDNVRFTKPSDGLYFQTDDASSNLSIILYTE